MLTAPSASPRSLLDKLWDEHAVARLCDDRCLIAIDRTYLHERTGSIALRELAAHGRQVVDPGRVFATMDHIVDTTDDRSDATRMPGGSAFITATRESSRAAGIRVFDVQDPDQGIVHVIAPELGLTLPGCTVACPDSHTCTQGALGALAFGIGSSEAEHVLATGTLRVRKPRSIRIRIEGRMPTGVTAKDLCLTLLARVGSSGASGAVIEYTGSVVSALSMEARLTLCNMSTELSAVSGVIAPDEVTLEYVSGRRYAPQGTAWEQAVDQWRHLYSDPGARFDQEIVIDGGGLAPRVTWGTSPSQSVALDAAVPTWEASALERDTFERVIRYMGVSPGQPLSTLAVDAAFIGSCTNSRLSDLRRAADVLRGRRVAAGVRAICVPGSMAVRRSAEAEGIDQVFRTAGFEWRKSGCSMCFFAGGESFGERERVISSTNRNFESRQGPQTRTHLASPETVAASAILGRIAGVSDLGRA